jgi:hypothetical protein
MMIVSDSVTYPNYVFATFHIQPQNFLNVIFLGLGLFTLRLLRMSKHKNKSILQQLKNGFMVFNKTNKGSKTNFFLIGSFMILSAYLLSGFPAMLSSVVSDLIFISTHLDYNYDQKMEAGLGPYYKYMRFVRDNTETESTILVPPQEFDVFVGNVGLDRYFLYPRILKNGDLNELPKSGFDYILFTPGWPGFGVSAHKVLLFDAKENATIEISGDYDPVNIQEEYSGLIKVRR